MRSIKLPFFQVYLLRNIILFLPNKVLSSEPVDYYCEFGFCDVDEYCCGRDKCCKKTSELWYFWVGIILVVATIIIVTAVRYFQKKFDRSALNRHYDPVPTQIIEET